MANLPSLSKTLLSIIEIQLFLVGNFQLAVHRGYYCRLKTRRWKVAWFHPKFFRDSSNCEFKCGNVVSIKWPILSLSAHTYDENETKFLYKYLCRLSTQPTEWRHLWGLSILQNRIIYYVYSSIELKLSPTYVLAGLAFKDDPCQPNPCLNGGHCIQLRFSRYRCECLGTNYYGDNCQKGNIYIQWL